MSEHAVSLLEKMLAEQLRQTQLLEQIATNQVALIQALGYDQDIGPDEQPLTYLSGQSCR